MISKVLGAVSVLLVRSFSRIGATVMAGKKLTLMPGAYDALSARVIEKEGFEAIVAGGYAAVGSMLAQADMPLVENAVASQMRCGAHSRTSVGSAGWKTATPIPISRVGR